MGDTVESFIPHLIRGQADSRGTMAGVGGVVHQLLEGQEGDEGSSSIMGFCRSIADQSLAQGTAFAVWE